VQGEKVDHRSDIFSLGVVLYEMITGHLPFKGDYDAAVTYSIINETPEPLARYKSDVPEDIQRMVSKALEKDVETRYQHIDDLLADIRRVGREKKATAEPRPSIAVLPFVDMSPQKDQEYFCDGMAEELISGLTRLDGLNVAARTSALQLKKRGYDIAEIGKRLKVQTVLDGSIRKAGDRLRISAQLVNVADGYHLWSAKYDRDMDDIFAIQDEISLTIVDKLKVRLLGEERSRLTKRDTENQEAYNLYLKGRYFWNRRYEGGLQKAIEHFQQAIEKDPGFALAYSGLADGFAMLGTYSFLPSKKAFTMAKNAALKALEIDDSLAEAVTSMAYINMFYDWDWEVAESGYKRAIEFDPHYASAHEWYGMLLGITGRYDESIDEMKNALVLDPLGLIINAMTGWAYHCLEQYDEAIEHYNKTIEMDPNFTLAYFFRGFAYIKKSMYQESIRSQQKFVELTGGSQTAVGALGFSYASSGDSDKAYEILDRLNKLATKKHVSPIYISLIHEALGEKEQALENLERAFLEREPFVILINCWHMFESLTSDPRHAELLRKLKLDK
jgi:serine/threonine-protein kinase